MSSSDVETWRLGPTDIVPTVVGISTSALGSMPASYGYAIDQQQAALALDRLLDVPFTFVDTGADHGMGGANSASPRRWPRAGASRSPRRSIATSALACSPKRRAVWGGLLSDVTGRVQSYGYRPLSDRLRAARAATSDACARCGVPLAAAALQFSTRDPRIHTTIVGLSRPDRAASTLALLASPIPSELWSELDALASPRSVWPDD